MNRKTLGGRRPLALLVAVVAAILGFIVLSAGPSNAQPSVSCWGDWCSGQDPAATGCDADAVTLASVPIDTGAGQLDMRYSRTCQTQWARWQQYPTGWCMNCTPVGLRAVQDTGYTQSIEFGYDGAPTPEAGGTYWTHMIYSPNNTVTAEVFMPCGGMSIFDAAMDCGINGWTKTPAM